MKFCGWWGAGWIDMLPKSKVWFLRWSRVFLSMFCRLRRFLVAATLLPLKPLFWTGGLTSESLSSWFEGSVGILPVIWLLLGSFDCRYIVNLVLLAGSPWKTIVVSFGVIFGEFWWFEWGICSKYWETFGLNLIVGLKANGFLWWLLGTTWLFCWAKSFGVAIRGENIGSSGRPWCTSTARLPLGSRSRAVEFWD